VEEPGSLQAPDLCEISSGEAELAGPGVGECPGRQHLGRKEFGFAEVGPVGRQAVQDAL
jgi:hypothetical protein